MIDGRFLVAEVEYLAMQDVMASVGLASESVPFHFGARVMVGWHQPCFLVGLNDAVEPLLHGWQGDELPSRMGFIPVGSLGQGLFTYMGYVFSHIYFYRLPKAPYYVFVPSNSSALLFPPNSVHRRVENDDVWSAAPRELVEAVTANFERWGVCPTAAKVYLPDDLSAMNVAEYVRYLLQHFDAQRVSTSYIIFSALHNNKYWDFVRFGWPLLVAEQSIAPVSERHLVYAAQVGYSVMLEVDGIEVPYFDFDLLDEWEG